MRLPARVAELDPATEAAELRLELVRRERLGRLCGDDGRLDDGFRSGLGLRLRIAREAGGLLRLGALGSGDDGHRHRDVAAVIPTRVRGREDRAAHADDLDVLLGPSLLRVDEPKLSAVAGDGLRVLPEAVRDGAVGRSPEGDDHRLGIDHGVLADRRVERLELHVDLVERFGRLRTPLLEEGHHARYRDAHGVRHVGPGVDRLAKAHGGAEPLHELTGLPAVAAADGADALGELEPKRGVAPLAVLLVVRPAHHDDARNGLALERGDRLTLDQDEERTA